MASTPTRLMTFAEFEQLPDPREGRYELRHGEPVLVPPPKLIHYDLQRRLRRLLDAAADSRWEVDIEMAFRPEREGEFRIADVAMISEERYRRDRGAGYIQGAPELVIEVLSPSNTMVEMLDKRDICLQNGAREFWLADPARRSVEVSTPDGRSVSYPAGKQIPLFWGGTIAVDDIFREA